MHAADLIILGVLGFSLVVGFVRGFVREGLALIGWVLAIYLARSYNEPMAAWLAQWVSTPSIRLLMAYASLFLGTLAVATLGAYAFDLVVKHTGLGLMNRFVGGLFGVARGLVISLVALMLMAPFVKNDAWFREAELPRYLLQYESVVRQIKDQALSAMTPVRSSSE